MLCCFLASDGIMLMYDLWRRVFFPLCRVVTWDGCFISPWGGMGCSPLSLSLSACLLRGWWKHRATLSRRQTSIRRATCQMMRAAKSHSQGTGGECARSGRSLNLRHRGSTAFGCQLLLFMHNGPFILNQHTLLHHLWAIAKICWVYRKIYKKKHNQSVCGYSCLSFYCYFNEPSWQKLKGSQMTQEIM